PGLPIERAPMSDEHWPYPSYADRSWLGGDRGADRALAAIVRALRALVAESGGRPGNAPEPLLHGMGHLASMAERIDWAMLSLVADARAPPNGCWPTTAPVGLSLT